MGNEDLVQLALKTLSCTQKELALRLGVSPTQISKWKKKEHMSQEMDEKIRSMLDIDDQDPSFILWAGSLQDADKWAKLIRFLAQIALDEAETGYHTFPLMEETDVLCVLTSHVLSEMGVAWPIKFPDELDIDYDTVYRDGENENFCDLLLEKNPYSSLIYKIYESLNDVYGFYAAYIDELIYDDDLDLINTEAYNIELSLMSLAACKVEVNKGVASKFREFKEQVTKQYEGWLNIVKGKAFRGGVPLRAEILDIIHGSHRELADGAEAESLGWNSSRLHPDIYMNELLCGMRVIHQVLPAIMKKLGIEDEFELDGNDLNIR